MLELLQIGPATLHTNSFLVIHEQSGTHLVDIRLESTGNLTHLHFSAIHQQYAEW